MSRCGFRIAFLLIRVRGGSVCPNCSSAFSDGVSVSPSRFAFVLVVLRVRWFLFHMSPGSVPLVGIPGGLRPTVRTMRRKSSVFQYRPAYTIRARRPAGALASVDSKDPKQNPLITRAPLERGRKVVRRASL